MDFAYIGLQTLKTLYEAGHITAAGLTAIAPIKWLVKNYPELLDQPEKAMKAIASTQDFSKPLTVRNLAQNTCGECIHFSSVHSCCRKRRESPDTLLAITNTSPACPDFDRVELPPFLNNWRQK